MTPEAFIAKWSEVTTKERASAQSHFNDLCLVLGEKTPHDADPTGEWYAFEKGVEKTGAGRGWADVWKRGHFGWEYKSKSGGRSSTMSNALKQLQLYALALESPPLLVVSDIDTIEIHTAFQNAVQEVHIIQLSELSQPEKLDLLRAVFSDPERLRPKRTRDQITAEAAGKFADLAFTLREEGHEPHVVAHFLNKILFCMFAEDAGVLKAEMFTSIAEKSVEDPENFDTIMKRLFQVMQTGGSFGSDIVDWFNGGLFDDDTTIPLALTQIRTLRDLARMDWSQIEPAIFGSLFERGLDPAKRSQLGAHYTDPGSIMRLVVPTIVEPLLGEWAATRSKIEEHIARAEKVKTKEAAKKRLKAANDVFHSYLERLRNFRVLDPACGSGNFLYLALQELKNIEHRANIEAEALGLQRQNPLVGPEAVLGIEISTYAAELARVTVWIGEIQWMLNHGYSLNKNPVLKPLDNIEERDAVLGEDGSEPEWPSADVIVGNPPFIGDRKMIRELGTDYVSSLRSLYSGRVPGAADFVTYWHEKARLQIETGQVDRVGLVATNSIRGGANRKILDRIVNTAPIFNAWSNEPWINDGAAVRVSLICYGCRDTDNSIKLDDNYVDLIHSDLTARVGVTGADLTKATPLLENRNVCFYATVKAGKFDVSGEIARSWLPLPNPHGKSNADVVKPWANAMSITRSWADKWVIDFGVDMAEEDAQLYEQPFRHVVQHVKPARDKTRRAAYRKNWWRFAEPTPGMRSAIEKLPRYIATPAVAKHRIFVWMPTAVLPDHALVVVARADDCCFGILQSKFHELWALRKGTSLEDRPRYTPTSVFETFPFPEGLTVDRPPDAYDNNSASQIADAAERLTELRDNWLNPPEWVDRLPEVVEGYPDRLVPKPGYEADLKKRTLTNLYNAKPAWLQNAHRQLDEAVATAYGWPADLTDDEVLAKLLALNLSRSSQLELSG